jgi:anti-anti-sigma factor
VSTIAEVRVDASAPEGVAIARVTGEVDGSNVEEVGAGLRAAVANHDHTLVVDLTGTGYVDSAGVNLLFALGEELRDHQQALRLVLDPQTPVARIAAITGLDRSHPTFGSVGEATA